MLKALLHDRPAGCGFEIFLKGPSFGVVRESDVRLDAPWAIFRGVCDNTRIMLSQPRLQITGCADRKMLSVETFKNLDVFQF